MISILLSLLHFIQISYSSQCTNSHSQQTLISVSIQGNSVNKIGVTEYLNIVQAATDVFLPSGTITAGLLTFGGPELAPYFTIDQGLISTTSANMQTLITGLSSKAFDANFGNSASDAMTQAINLMTTTTAQKYHVIFSAGNPQGGGFGTATDATKVTLGLSGAPAKEANIQTIVVLIGVEGINFAKEFYSTLVEDPSTDIIVIDPENPSYTQLSAVLCKENGYDVKITEVKTNNNGATRFIEVLNRGATATICAGWSGNTCVSMGSVATGSYATSNPGSNGALTSWTAIAEIGGTEVDRVAYDSSSQFFQEGISGQSFELRGAGFNNQYGTNWRLSCSNALNGSPGDAPSDCVSSDDCSDCTANGDSSATCDSIASAYCSCSTQYLDDISSCIPMPVPTQCSAYVVTDIVSGDDYMYFSWDKVQYDGSVSYRMVYDAGNNLPSSCDSTDWSQCDWWNSGNLAAYPVKDYRKTGSSIYELLIEVTYKAPLSNKEYTQTSNLLQCQSFTVSPTKSPTAEPTPSPTMSPSFSPTNAPTPQQPGVFISSSSLDTCLFSQCDCFDYDRSCCVPFGPSEDADTLTSSSIVPPEGCSNHFSNILIPSGNSELYTSDIKFVKSGALTQTTVYYTITAYGQISNDNFTDLTTWTDYYDNSRRRRRRLQSNNTFGNKLNVRVEPPGSAESYSGQVVIATGATDGTLQLNISTDSLKCVPGNPLGCVTYDECLGSSLGFGLTVTSCADSVSSFGECSPMYPTTMWFSVARDPDLCAIVFGKGNEEDELPNWFWWVLIALILFLLCLAWLVYRFWWKQKKTAQELGDAEDELHQQHADNEAGFGKDLDVGDVAFNPMATGVPGMEHQKDAFGNELHQRQMQQQNDMVDVQAEVFQVRQDYGQVQTGNRHHNQM